MRIAFFGGTFDPPHCGHLAIAHAAITRLALDRVLMAPVAAQPLKRTAGQASFADRLAMVKLAVAGDPRLVASNVDAPRPTGKPNYTLDTLVGVRSTLAPDDVLFCLLGADAFLTLHRWHRAADLVMFCDFVVAGRPGSPLSHITKVLPSGIKVQAEHRGAHYLQLDLSGPHGRSSKLYLLPDLEENISATEIRNALAGGVDAQNILAPQVAEYIHSHALYRSEAS